MSSKIVCGCDINEKTPSLGMEINFTENLRVICIIITFLYMYAVTSSFVLLFVFFLHEIVQLLIPLDGRSIFSIIPTIMYKCVKCKFQ